MTVEPNLNDFEDAQAEALAVRRSLGACLQVLAVMVAVPLSTHLLNITAALMTYGIHAEGGRLLLIWIFLWGTIWVPCHLLGLLFVLGRFMRRSSTCRIPSSDRSH